MTKHGMHDSPEHKAWRSMKHRCANPRSGRYDRYGARGITVCQRWRESFESFYADMGSRPSPDHSIDRINNDGNYEPGNCRWATTAEQNRNRSDNVRLSFDGREMTASEWARELCINRRTLYLRLSTGWTIENALTRPTEHRPWNGQPKSSWKRKSRTSESSPTVKLTREQVAIIREQLASGVSGKALAELFGVSNSAISSIKLGKSWHDIKAGDAA
jgi:hypothetical protein